MSFETNDPNEPGPSASECSQTSDPNEAGPSTPESSQTSDQAKARPSAPQSSQTNNKTEAKASAPESSQTNEQTDAGPSMPVSSQTNVQTDGKPSDPKSGKSNNRTEATLTIADISPLPKCSQTKRFVNRKKGKFGMLNGSPDITQLKAAVAEKNAKALRKSARRTKKRIVLAESSDEEEPFAPDDEDPSCIYCMEPWSHSRAKEWWLQCQTCRQWCHAECIGLPKTSKRVICDICQ